MLRSGTTDTERILAQATLNVRCADNSDTTDLVLRAVPDTRSSVWGREGDLRQCLYNALFRRGVCEGMYYLGSSHCYECKSMALKVHKAWFYTSTAMPKLKFEKLDVDALSARVSRARIPGGWLLIATSSSGGGVTFYPDPQHKWDGGSVADAPGNATLAAPRAR